MEFYFSTGRGWDGITEYQATQLVAYLPTNIQNLSICYSHFGKKFWVTLIQRVEKSSKMGYLNLADIKGDDNFDVGLRLAEMISCNNRIIYFFVFRTYIIQLNNVEQWRESLMKNNTLIYFRLIGVEADIKSVLQQLTNDRTLKLEIN